MTASSPPRDLLALVDAYTDAWRAWHESNGDLEVLKDVVHAEVDLKAALAHAGGDWMAGYERGKADAANLVMNRDDAPWAVISDHVLIQIGAAIMKLTTALATPGERSEAVGHSISDSVKAVAARRFKCMARAGGVGGHDVQDCDYPHCGCGPAPATPGGDGLRSALEQAAAWFEEYAQMHLAKGAHEKSARNQERASFLRLALAKHPPTPSVEAAHDAERVERVARALFNYGRKKKSSLRWENVEPSYRKWAFDQARAALAAIAPEVRG